MLKGRIKILYVDDDRNNLEVFKASFRRDYEIFLATSAKDGMEILNGQDIHVIIADQKMPEISGVEFFEQILKEHPAPVRILLTGYTDIDSVIDAINKGQVYRYITKPWNDQDLRLAIENAYEIYDVRRRLEETNKELRKRNDELSRFVYSASHELKAPLSTISGILKMAKDNKDIEPSQYFTMIEKCSNNLQVFIKNIVDYYRNQRYDQKVELISFEELVKELLESFLFYEHIADINFNIAVNQDQPFASDLFRIKIVLNNILSNSIKYQKQDNTNKEINISIQVSEKSAEIILEDNGIGIPEQYQQNIFNMFFRATEIGQGSGIGLYIVKEAVEKINGLIEVSSTEGLGTIFKLSLPNKIHEIKLMDTE